MIRGTVNAKPAIDYLDEMKFRVLNAVEVGMKEAMDDLASAAAGRAPVLTGRLRAAILASPRVIRTAKYIEGTVSGNVGGRHVANYLEFGVAAAVPQKKEFMRFTAADGTLVFTKHRGAIPARPFMNATLQERKEALMEIIAERIRAVL